MYPEDERDGTALPYPFGTADISEIAGNRFNRTRFLKVPTFLFVGEEENSPESGPLEYEIKSQGKLFASRAERVREVIGRNPLDITKRYAQFLREQGTSVKLSIKPDTGHKCTPEDVEEGLRRLLKLV